jgi:hypothetical protein
VADAESLPDGWRRDAEFVITLVNHKDPKKSISKGWFIFISSCSGILGQFD